MPVQHRTAYVLGGLAVLPLLLLPWWREAVHGDVRGDVSGGVPHLSALHAAFPIPVQPVGSPAIPPAVPANSAVPARDAHSSNHALSVCASRPLDLTIVMVSRNDNYGQTGLQRMARSVECLLRFDWKTFGVSAELVIVAWNQLPDRPPLKEALTLPTERHLPVRYIEVPASLHKSYDNADVVPLFEYYAKNAAARRGRGRWVWCTNPDNLFGPQLLRSMARDISHSRLDPTLAYAAHRIDIRKKDVSCIKHAGWPYPLPGEHTDSNASCNVSYVSTSAFEGYDAQGKAVPFLANVGDFLLTSCDSFVRVRGYAEVPHNFGCDTEIFCAFSGRGVRVAVYGDGPPCEIYHQFHSKGSHNWFQSNNATFERPWSSEACKIRLVNGNDAADKYTGRSADWGLRGIRLPEVIIAENATTPMWGNRGLPLPAKKCRMKVTQ